MPRPRRSTAARPRPGRRRYGEGDTIWMGAADASGLVVSYIQSIYWEFGSGCVLPRTGVLMQNRGASFSLDPRRAEPARARPAAVPHAQSGARRAEGRPRHGLWHHGRRRPAANAGGAVHAPRAVPPAARARRSTRRAGCSAAPGARPTPICGWNRRFDGNLIDRLMSAGHDVDVLAERLFRHDGPCRRGGAASGRHAGRRARSARRWRRGRGINSEGVGSTVRHRPPFRRTPCYRPAALRWQTMLSSASAAAVLAGLRRCPRPGARASACLGDDEERGGLRARRDASPASATPGPSTTCSRPSRPRASTARRRASSPARSWRRSPRSTSSR